MQQRQDGRQRIFRKQLLATKNDNQETNGVPKRAKERSGRTG